MSQKCASQTYSTSAAKLQQLGGARSGDNQTVSRVVASEGAYRRFESHRDSGRNLLCSTEQLRRSLSLNLRPCVRWSAFPPQVYAQITAALLFRSRSSS